MIFFKNINNNFEMLGIRKKSVQISLHTTLFIIFNFHWTFYEFLTICMPHPQTCTLLDGSSSGMQHRDLQEADLEAF